MIKSSHATVFDIVIIGQKATRIANFLIHEKIQL